MPPTYARHLFVCTNRRPDGAPRPSCAARGGEQVRDALKKELAGRGLHEQVRGQQAGCLDACDHGVCVVVYPEGVWYAGVEVDDVKELVESHVMNGRPVTRLLAPLPGNQEHAALPLPKLPRP